MYIFYLKYIVELLRAPLYNFFFYIIFFPGISKKKVRTQTLTKNKNYRALSPILAYYKTYCGCYNVIDNVITSVILE